MALNNYRSRNKCAHTGYTEPEKPPEDGEMSQVTLHARHRIQNQNRSEVEHITSQSQKLPTILNLYTQLDKKKK